MKLVLIACPKWTTQQLTIIEELSFHTTKLYNIANYSCRENYIPYKQLDKDLKSNWHSSYLHSHTRQQCLKVLEQNWKSYFNSSKDYKNYPGKYRGTPRPPRYKHVENKKNEVIFTNFAIRRRNGQLLLSLAKAMQQKFGVESLKVEENFPLPQTAIIQQIRFQHDRQRGRWVLLVIYQVTPETLPQGHDNIMAIDLGLDNLATITFSHVSHSYIICGRGLKDINRHINHQIARLQSIRMKQVGEAMNFRNTRQINALRRRRHDKITDTLHKGSRKIIQLAQEYQVGKIVLGNLKGIKHENKLKTFVQIPLQRFAHMVTYKAELAGIEVESIKEHYTSGVSSLDLEPITAQHYDKARRITRGLFKSETGILVNADVNGSLNILRKSYDGIPNLIQSVRDSGCVDHPKRLRVA